MHAADLAAHPVARFLVGNIVKVSAAGDVDAAMVAPRAACGRLVRTDSRPGHGRDQRLEAFGGRGMPLAGNRDACTVERLVDRAAARHPVPHVFTGRHRDAGAAGITQFVAAVPPAG